MILTEQHPLTLFKTQIHYSCIVWHDHWSQKLKEEKKWINDALKEAQWQKVCWECFRKISQIVQILATNKVALSAIFEPKRLRFHTFSELTLWNCNWQIFQGFQYFIDSKILHGDFFFCKIYSLNLEFEKLMKLQHVKISSLAKIVWNCYEVFKLQVKQSIRGQLKTIAKVDYF